MDRNNTMITTDITEKELHPASGMLILILNIVGILFGIFLGIISPILFYGGAAGLGVIVGVLLIILFCIMFGGLKVVNPNEALVVLCGDKKAQPVVNSGSLY